MSGYSWTTDNAGSPGFDADDRLTYWKRSDNNLTQNWTLSLVGDWNAFASQGTNQTRAHGPTHELTSVTIGNNTDTLQHDAKGNVTFIPAVLSAIGSDLALSWDFDNRLVGANTDGQPADEVTFQYDAQGRRISKTVNGSTTVFVHAGQQIVADYPSGAAATSPSEKYVYASYIDEPILKDGTLPSGTGLAYYHHDRRYTITALTDSTGSAVERYAYSPHGSLTILDGSGSAIASSQTANRYTYTGRELNIETHLYHFRARYYSPTLGRFLTRDPLGYVDGMSLYRGYFVPGMVDPMGLGVDCITIGGEVEYYVGGGITFALCADECGGLALIGFYKVKAGIGVSVGVGFSYPAMDCIREFKKDGFGWEGTASAGPITGAVNGDFSSPIPTGGSVGGGGKIPLPGGGNIPIGGGVGWGSSAGGSAGDLDSPGWMPDPKFKGVSVNASAGYTNHFVISMAAPRCPCPKRPDPTKPDPGCGTVVGKEMCDDFCTLAVLDEFGNQMSPVSVAAYEHCMDNCFQFVTKNPGKEPSTHIGNPFAGFED